MSPPVSSSAHVPVADLSIVEVSPRDGLQNLPGTLVPTETKRRLITKLLDAGVRTIEVGSFVRKDRVPQMADSAQLLPTLPRPDEVPPPRAPGQADPLSGIPETSGRIPPQAGRASYPVLIPNLKGFEALMALEEAESTKQGGRSKRLTRDVAVFVSATEVSHQLRLAHGPPGTKSRTEADALVGERAKDSTDSQAFSKANNNASIDKVLQGIADVVANAKLQDLNVRGYVSCVMSDPYSGPTAPDEVVRVTQRLFDLGCDEVSLGDTTGEGNPTQWVKLWHALSNAGVDMDRIAAHCHDTFAMSLPSITALLPLGLRTIDTSVAGLGGCPYSPGATGNVPTEDVVYALHKMGYETGIDLEKLVDVGAWLSREVGVNNESRVGRAIYARKKAREGRDKKLLDTEAEKEFARSAHL